MDQTCLQEVRVWTGCCSFIKLLLSLEFFVNANTRTLPRPGWAVLVNTESCVELRFSFYTWKLPGSCIFFSI